MQFLPLLSVPATAAQTLPLPAAPGGSYDAAKSEQVYTSLLTASRAYPSTTGALKVGEVNGFPVLVGANGKPAQLRGMSTHGLQWFPLILNDNAFRVLRTDWNVNVVRLAMYIGEGGYSVNRSLPQRVIEGIELAIANDMYVIVDWHVLSPGDPNASIYAGAQDFFKRVSARFPNSPNIIYEVVNEPNDSHEPGVSNDADGWAKVKAYAEPIVQMLRQSGNNNLVLVGSPSWSQRPDLAALNPVRDENVAYSIHFYAGSHPSANTAVDRNNVMSNMRFAMERGQAVFVSEWGASRADGSNGLYFAESDRWLDFLNRHHISWVNWSLANKDESSAAFDARTSLDPGKRARWDDIELSASGRYLRSRIKGISMVPARRPRR